MKNRVNDTDKILGYVLDLGERAKRGEDPMGLLSAAQMAVVQEVVPAICAAIAFTIIDTAYWVEDLDDQPQGDAN